jgi:hypothetical protein
LLRGDDLSFPDTYPSFNQPAANAPCPSPTGYHSVPLSFLTVFVVSLMTKKDSLELQPEKLAAAKS